MRAVLLFRTGRARFEQLIDDPASALDMEVHERLLVDGSVGELNTPLIHEDYKGLEAYIARHNKYSTWEARLRQTYFDEGAYGEQAVEANLFGDAQERRRFLKKVAVRLPLEPWLWFFYHYILRLGFLEGRPRTDRQSHPEKLYRRCAGQTLCLAPGPVGEAINMQRGGRMPYGK